MNITGACGCSPSSETTGAVSTAGGSPDLVRTFREAGLALPPPAQILAELRQRFARGERHLHADHQLSIEKRPDLRLDLDNVRTRCDACHRSKTNREDGGFGRQRWNS